MQKLDSSLSRVNGLEEPVYSSVVTSFSKTFKTSNTLFAFNISLKIFHSRRLSTHLQKIEMNSMENYESVTENLF